MPRSTGPTILPLAAILAIGPALSACAEDLTEPSSDLLVTERAIFYGTREPTATNLSSGEQLAIGFLAEAGGSPFCTATLIDRDVAITAKHCVEGTIAVENMRFGMGDPGAPEALVAVHSAPYHSTLDAALLLLREDAVSRVPSAEPIPFLRQPPSQDWIGTGLEAAGYGETHDNSEGRYFVQVELTAIQSDFLVVNGWGERGICFGDSGGPLFAHVGSGEPVIAGIESHGDGSCVDQDFETRLDRAASWIDSEVGVFDPNSSPQTGTQDGDAGECQASELGGGLSTGQSDKCLGLPSCNASAATTTRIGTTGFLLLLAIAGARRRYARQR